MLIDCYTKSEQIIYYLILIPSLKIHSISLFECEFVVSIRIFHYLFSIIFHHSQNDESLVFDLWWDLQKPHPKRNTSIVKYKWDRMWSVLWHDAENKIVWAMQTFKVCIFIDAINKCLTDVWLYVIGSLSLSLSFLKKNV